MTTTTTRTVLILSLLSASPARAENVADHLPAYCTNTTQADLGQLIACRLAVSELVGVDKKRTGAAIEDRAREAVVIEAAVKRGADLDADTVRQFFAAQIEASKTVQREVMNQPERTGTPSVAALRGVLDELTTKLLANLAGSCRENTFWSVINTDRKLNIAAALLAVEPLPSCRPVEVY